jgi:hypothetical protein
VSETRPCGAPDPQIQNTYYDLLEGHTGQHKVVAEVWWSSGPKQQDLSVPPPCHNTAWR